MPRLADAVAQGEVPAAALTAISAEARGLDARAREELYGAFADGDRLRRLDPEELVQAVRDTAPRLAPAARDRDQLRPIEDRFLALQPRLDGSLIGYFELDAVSGPPCSRRSSPRRRSRPPGRRHTRHLHRGRQQRDVCRRSAFGYGACRCGA